MIGLRGADTEIRVHTRNSWSQENEDVLHLGKRRVKRYDKNAWKNWKPGDPDPWADTQADYDREYKREQADKRWRQEENRRYKEEKAKTDAYYKEVAGRRKNISYTAHHWC